MFTTAQIISIVVFVCVFALIISEKVHRTTAALAGAVILWLTHVITFDQGMEEIDFNTLGVLIGMMLFVAVAKQSGIFEFLAIKSAKLAKGDPWRIMMYFIIITAVCSAFLDNVTTVLLIAPMTFTICKILDTSPVPYFMTQILASNVGGTATLIGDPPNIMIGSGAGLSFADFINYDGLCCLIILIVLIALFYLIYGRKLTSTPEEREAITELNEADSIRDRSLMNKSIVMIILVIIAFMVHDQLGLESSMIALTAAAVMLIIGGQDIEEMIMGVEWTTIGFFAGLFVVVGGMVQTGVIDMLAQALIDVTGGDPIVAMLVILFASAIISSILDNIPFTATMIPIIVYMGTQGMDIQPLWWALSLGACLGGNGTLIGASANVVLSGISTRQGYPITFMDFTKIGFPLMIVTVVIAAVYLMVRFVWLV